MTNTLTNPDADAVQCARDEMTAERAADIRGWRIEGCTWRRIGDLYVDRYVPLDVPTWCLQRGAVKGDLFVSQFVGMALCEAAAPFFGETWTAPPWNGDETDARKP